MKKGKQELLPYESIHSKQGCAGSLAKNLESSQPTLKLEPLFGQLSKVQITAREGTARGTDPSQFAASSCESILSPGPS
jgi:hypothetical protein